MAYPPIPLPYTTNRPWSFLVWLLMWGVIRGHTIRETEMKAHKPASRTAAHSITVLTTETERAELTSDTGDPLSFFFFICHVKLQTCQSQDFLQFNFQGQMASREDPTAGDHFPSPATLPTKSQGRSGSKDQIIVLFPQLHPLTVSEPSFWFGF